MSPMSLSFKRLQQRLRRSLCYGSRRMKSLPFPLCELAMNYFDKHCPYDYISMDSATSLSCHGYVDACTFLVAMVYLDRIRTTDKTCFESSDPGQFSSELYQANVSDFDIRYGKSDNTKVANSNANGSFFDYSLFTSTEKKNTDLSTVSLYK
ncbi:unnamed protein product, partial [Onchocerca ochengi]|uniref:RGM_N domain-containing protein n=1 Tax=Onchocerca ochengi TaxID=42157 RepID=A0A182EHC5_ONCOC